MSKLDKYICEFKKYVPSICLNRTFYFDESNNIKKGIIGYDNDNNNDLENTYFVLGGIALSKPLDFEGLLKCVGAKQKPVDAKYRFFSFNKTAFLEAIKQKRLRLFFEYLIRESVLIHFDVAHLMHLAIVDILDSLIEERDINQQMAFYYYKELQSDMTEVLYVNYGRTHDFLCKYGYPNVPKEKANDFINELYIIYTDNLVYFDSEEYPGSFTRELLRQIIKAKRDKKNLYFLEDNKSFVVYEDLHQTYLSRVIEVDDKKVFDEESSLMDYFQSIDDDYESKLKITFANSKESREIQISDVICGFVGKLYNYLSHNDISQIAEFINSSGKNSNELKTLKAFNRLMTISNNKSTAMFKKVNPLFIERRFAFMFSLIEEVK